MNELNLHNILYPKRKCIINADLDGILSGMLLQKFLNWEIVGFSSCSGNEADEIWISTPRTNVVDCVFVDLPVAYKRIDTIDQHFVLFSRDSVDRYMGCGNKINPNAMRGFCYNNGNYTSKYPFGTVHFIIACLENIGVIKDVIFHKDESLPFDSLDVLFRADGVIKNMYNYTLNCSQWCNWMTSLGGDNTKFLFDTVLTDYIARYSKLQKVEKMLKSLGCARQDGDCSNMLRNNDLISLNKYISTLADMFSLDTIKINNIQPIHKLVGHRASLNCFDEKEVRTPNIFSYAMVDSSTISITKIKTTDT